MADDAMKPWTGIVLAAGHSRRAGVFKPAYEVRGRALVAHAVDSLAARCGRVVVVTGHRREEIEALMSGRPEAECVFNPEHAGDMFLSVQAGVRAVDPTSPGTFLLPVDCPFVGPAALDALTGAFLAAGGERPCVPEHAGRGGHPVLLAPGARDAVLAAEVPVTLREVLRGMETVRVAVDDGAVLVDADTAEELEGIGGEGPGR